MTQRLNKSLLRSCTWLQPDHSVIFHLQLLSCACSVSGYLSILTLCDQIYRRGPSAPTEGHDPGPGSVLCLWPGAHPARIWYDPSRGLLKVDLHSSPGDTSWRRYRRADPIGMRGGFPENKAFGLASLLAHGPATATLFPGRRGDTRWSKLRAWSELSLSWGVFWNNSTFWPPKMDLRLLKASSTK